jgi:hypothetical protein
MRKANICGNSFRMTLIPRNAPLEIQRMNQSHAALYESLLNDEHQQMRMDAALLVDYCGEGSEG